MYSAYIHIIYNIIIYIYIYIYIYRERERQSDSAHDPFIDSYKGLKLHTKVFPKIA